MTVMIQQIYRVIQEKSVLRQEKIPYVKLCPYNPFFPDATAPIIESSWSHSDTPQSVGLLWTCEQPNIETSTWKHSQNSQQTDIHAPGGIRSHNPSKRAAEDPRLRPRGHWDRHNQTHVQPKLLRRALRELIAKPSHTKTSSRYIKYSVAYPTDVSLEIRTSN